MRCVNTAGTAFEACGGGGGPGGGLTDTELRATPVPVSGTVTVTDGAGALNVIVDSGTTTVTQATGTNLHAVIDTGSTTAVTQATGTNLHAVLDTGSALIGKVGIDQTTPGTTNRVDIGAALPAGSAVIGHVIVDTTSTTAATQATAANLNAQVQGAAASAASKAGNPVQIGGVFNTTQPTVTTGQAVEAQSTARGAQIVAPGVDNFAVQATLAAETTKVIGTVNIAASQTTAVTQATATNLNAAVVGTGTAGAPAGNILTIQGVASMTKLLVTPDSIALPANQSTNIAQVGGTNTVSGGAAGSLAIGGTVATNVAITANPLNLGAQAVSSENSAATTARQVQLVADLVGKLIVLPYANPENFIMGTTAAITDTTSTSTIASAGGSLRNYITSVLVTNSHATVGTFVKILDGSTIIWEGYAAAAGGGFASSFPVPLKGTAATAINCQPVTTGANVICSAAGYKGL